MTTPLDTYLPDPDFDMNPKSIEAKILLKKAALAEFKLNPNKLTNEAIYELDKRAGELFELTAQRVALLEKTARDLKDTIHLGMLPNHKPRIDRNNPALNISPVERRRRLGRPAITIPDSSACAGRHAAPSSSASRSAVEADHSFNWPPPSSLPYSLGYRPAAPAAESTISNSTRRQSSNSARRQSSNSTGRQSSGGELDDSPTNYIASASRKRKVSDSETTSQSGSPAARRRTSSSLAGSPLSDELGEYRLLLLDVPWKHSLTEPGLRSLSVQDPPNTSSRRATPSRRRNTNPASSPSTAMAGALVHPGIFKTPPRPRTVGAANLSLNLHYHPETPRSPTANPNGRTGSGAVSSPAPYRSQLGGFLDLARAGSHVTEHGVAAGARPKLDAKDASGPSNCPSTC